MTSRRPEPGGPFEPFKEESPGRLVWRLDDGGLEVGLGILLIAFSILLAWGARSSLDMTHSTFGAMTTAARLGVALLSGSLGLLGGLGGLYMLFRRHGITIDRGRRQVSVWHRWFWMASEDVYPLERFRAVEVSRALVSAGRLLPVPKSCAVFPVALAEPGGGRLVIFPVGRDAGAAQGLAMNLAGFLSFPLDDRSAGPAPKSRWLPLDQQAPGHFRPPA